MQEMPRSCAGCQDIGNWVSKPTSFRPRSNAAGNLWLYRLRVGDQAGASPAVKDAVFDPGSPATLFFQ
jgi:hypothetical protein